MAKLTVDLTKDLANIDPIRAARLIKQGKLKEVEELEKSKTISIGAAKKKAKKEEKKID